ncbi:tubulin/FtsZ family protein [Natrinema thermotolerans]|uniref:Tubulin-like protein CetZ n=1 Tax=Natrinema thermotolerans TaxID=121872 RepID=A0AAF0PBU4_9EURY|nr:tubulin/FtsZ family protein [Natrinema thermotolerans]ELZ15595.1 Tubulin/FtsZ GTPase [Natrinema thermotolerans DSM 11552]QCC60694.1 cell division protein FtsZ [Natrinema thermotolerans]QCC61575.1 cell division protein FtsZ [Natrinema thermotolerans]WMT07736.1 tubulin/FtsZ family protein [Natrinema thermotolerans]WMT08368.1 tubulin/FtsZ family protein [Natrinema thermotolerans]
MKLALIGFGQAGGKVVDEFLAFDERTGGGFVESAIAVNSATTDLKGLERVPERNRVLVGQARVKGHGVGADNELGAEIAEADIDEIQGAIDRIPVHEIDAFLVVAGMGGGTGSGGAPVLAKHLRRIYTQPVYGLGILPGTDEGGIYTLNAARSFRTFVDEVDNLLVFDNDAWRSAGESVAGGYDRINREIVERFGLLFAAGEIDQGDHVAESVVDSSEIINTLSGGGVSTIGYASETVETDDGLLSSLTGDDGFDEGAATNRLTSLVRKATLGRLTLPCDVASADRGLVVATGPPSRLNRKGVERGRQWLEDETGSMEIRGGDYPLPDRSEVGTIVLLSGVTDVPRIDQLQQVAIEAQETTEDVRAQADEAFTSLMDTGGELDALF